MCNQTLQLEVIVRFSRGLGSWGTAGESPIGIRVEERHEREAEPAWAKNCPATQAGPDKSPGAPPNELEGER
jgi:hypothetical protein